MNTKHVTSLEISQKLKALGVPQESEFYWVRRNVNEKQWIENLDGSRTSNGYKWIDQGWSLDRLSPKEFRSMQKNLKDAFGSGLRIKIEFISAFLASELGELLPDTVYTGKAWRTVGKLYWCSDERVDGSQQGKTMTESMAKMLIYLKENKLI